MKSVQSHAAKFIQTRKIAKAFIIESRDGRETEK